MASHVSYIGKTCSQCNSKQYSGVPLYVTIALLFVLIVLFSFMYVKFLLAKNTGQVCWAMFRKDRMSRKEFDSLIDTAYL